MKTETRPKAPIDEVRDVLRERRERIGPYVKARHVADALEVRVQTVTPRLSALVDAGDLELWSETSPRTYRITLEDVESSDYRDRKLAPLEGLEGRGDREAGPGGDVR